MEKINNKINNAIIFAAGKGTRMSPLTQYIPKPLIKVRGIPLIERNIEYLKMLGINNISIVVGYLGDQFKYLQEKYGVKLIENPDYETSNNISSLYYSHNLFNNTLYIEGDLFIDDINVFKNAVSLIKENYNSIAFSQKNKQHNSEWGFVNDLLGNVIKHKLYKDSYNKNIWSGFLFLNEDICKEINEKIGEYYQNEKNKQNYFETFLWTLKSKMKHISLGVNVINELDSFNDLLKIDETYSINLIPPYLLLVRLITIKKLATFYLKQ
ncbi:sugar phosphate nucleotidyltransferase [Mycoplasma crocodyli]|uniref:Nucleotidyl transferase domain-containing protein n=1 Tax=Mycoplasma crocodyli (strain ATCC 51981 / MP145) TaxID=512564 RepID=D5E5H0_MYCCM|nr:sugar phosphate nucleotidyltransferase [Mycoplasma crocodyli]ADE19400.1 hypothetical protein MCRO_0378 [Mycoplasma crocodyli MP145]